MINIFLPYVYRIQIPLFSINDIRPFSYLLLPAELLSSYPFPNYKYLTAVSSPIRIFHGTDDAVVPYHSGKKLYESVRFKKDVQFISIEGGEHKNLSEFEKFGAEMRIVLGSN